MKSSTILRKNIQPYSTFVSATQTCTIQTTAQSDLSVLNNLKAGGKISTNIKKENYGRWSKDEHTRFVEAIKLYGKNWKLIEKHIKTRSRPQIRSHAQKFFKRLEISLRQLKRKNSYEDESIKTTIDPQQLKDETPQISPKASYESLITRHMTQENNDKINQDTTFLKKREPNLNLNSGLNSIWNVNFDPNDDQYTEIKQRSYKMGFKLQKYLKKQLRTLNKINLEILKLNQVDQQEKFEVFQYSIDTTQQIQSSLSYLENSFLFANTVDPPLNQANTTNFNLLNLPLQSVNNQPPQQQRSQSTLYPKIVNLMMRDSQQGNEFNPQSIKLTDLLVNFSTTKSSLKVDNKLKRSMSHSQHSQSQPTTDSEQCKFQILEKFSSKCKGEPTKRRKGSGGSFKIYAPHKLARTKLESLRQLSDTFYDNYIQELKEPETLMLLKNYSRSNSCIM